MLTSKQRAALRAAAKAAAGQIGPDAAPCGVAQLCRQLWPEAF